MQSLIQPTAMNSNENLLICGEHFSVRIIPKLTPCSAPTGAVSLLFRSVGAGLIPAG